MPRNDGDIFGAGVRILLVGANEPLPVTAGAIAYLHFVDGDGNTIVPTYEPQGYQTSQGSLSGAKYTLIGPAELTALAERITELEEQLASITSRIEITETGLKLKNSDGATVFEVGLDNVAALAFFGHALQPKTGVVSPASGDDVANELQGYGLISVS
jgi:hypothetical protein